MSRALMTEVANSCRIPIMPTSDSTNFAVQIIAASEADEELYLDVIDAVLQLTRGAEAHALTAALQQGGSVWKVRDDKLGLERRVPEATMQAYGLAVSVSDPVADELKDAWAAVFGRSPDPSDGWDHAIKAVEDLLIPIVVPKASKPNLGTVAGELKANPARWDFGLPANGGRVNGETLEGLIRLIWPNPDRHGGVDKRAPTQEEAQSAVQVAVAIVGLCRNRLKRKS